MTQPNVNASETPELSAQEQAVEGDKKRLFEEILPNVAFDGWGQGSLKMAAERLEIPVIYAEELFPNTDEMIRYFGQWVDQKMIENIDLETYQSLRIRDKVKFAVEKRLEILSPHKEAFRRAFGYVSLPQNIALGHKMTWQTCDQIWKLAGDRSEDYNYYTKRGLLEPVLGATMLYWLSDETEDFEPTRDFLGRRLEDVLKIGGAFGKLLSKFKSQETK